jgi:hypothetical protein
MTKDVQERKITLAELGDMTEEALAARYEASRDKARKVRNKVLSKFVANSNSDK